MKTPSTTVCLAECLASLLWLAMLNAALAQTVLELTPPEMRGTWYPKGDIGQGQCAKTRHDGAGELQPGALQITHTQLVDWRAGGQNTVIFVTKVRHRRRHVWRLQGLEDVFPYEVPKGLQTYIFEFAKAKSELSWSRRSFDVVTERLNTRLYERCL